jgi:molybdate transport system ATP-binding protein
MAQGSWRKAKATQLQSASTKRNSQPELEVALRKTLSPAFTLDVSFTAPPGVTMLFGASGAGKTTLLECIAGLIHPDRGQIRIGGRTVFDANSEIDVATAKRGVGYVFQTLALFPHLDVASNVCYGLNKLDAAEAARRVNTVLEAFRIAPLRRRRPAEISGGERQRVALARALVTDPCTLLLDEPLSALDAATKKSILDDLRAWNESHRIPVVYVTHSREELFALGERVIALEQGSVIAEGEPHAVLSAPRQESLASLAGFENIFDATVTSLHESAGTMTCRIGDRLEIEAPLGHVQPGEKVRIAVRAGDILLANTEPRGLSARNLLPGRIVSLVRRDVTVIAQVDCGALFEVHITPAAVSSLQLRPDAPVWLVVKTHSCHLVR